jgi:hypothetical protein
MPMRTILLAIVGIAVAIALWISKCSGPQPVVQGQPTISAPEAPGDPYRVEVAVRNAGPGHGQVEVIVRLLDRAAGRTYQGDEQVDLEAGEENRVVVEIFAPPRTYDVDVDTRYPPD